MPENENPTLEYHPNGNTPTQPIACPECTTMLNVESPHMAIFNHPLASIVQIFHIKGIECYRCGNYFTLFCPAIQNGQILLQLMPTIKPQEANKIIEAPPNLRNLIKH